jgi:hypothetical protein
MNIPTDLLTIDEARDKYFGPRISPFSLRRWISKGLGNPPLKLKSLRIAGRHFVRPCDLEEFIEASANPELYRRRQKTARVEKAKKRLVKAGA